MTGNRGKMAPFYQKRAEYERLILMQAIAANVTHTAAAKSLGLGRPYFCRLMKHLGIDGRYHERRALAEGRAGIEVEA